jgi:type II secretory pathway component PulK
MTVTSKTRQRKKPARGMTAVAVLVCLIIMTMITGAILKVSLAQRDQLRAQERRLQAEWLAESGIQRALARLDTEPDYRGETWEISARDLDSSEAARVMITVESVAENQGQRQVRAQADYPRDPPQRSRNSKQVTIDRVGPG